MERRVGPYVLSDDRTRIQIPVVCELVQGSYWGSARSRETIERSLEHSLCYGAYEDGVQRAFARVVTDYAVMFWLCDVLVHPEHRGRGLGKALVEMVLATPALAGLSGILASRDARGLYARYGFVQDTEGRFMRRVPELPGGIGGAKAEKVTPPNFP